MICQFLNSHAVILEFGLPCRRSQSALWKKEMQIRFNNYTFERKVLHFIDLFLFPLKLAVDGPFGGYTNPSLKQN